MRRPEGAALPAKHLRRVIAGDYGLMTRWDDEARAAGYASPAERSATAA